MATQIRFFPMELSYTVGKSGEEFSAVVNMYGRTQGGERVCVADGSFKPYFYVKIRDGVDKEEIRKKIEKLNVEVGEQVAKVVSTRELKKRLLGKEIGLVEIVLNIPSGVPNVREIVKGWEMVEEIYEYDIPFVRRYSIDKGIIPMTLCEAEGEFVENKDNKMKVSLFKAEKIICEGSKTLQKPKILAVDIETHSRFDEGFDFEKDPIIMLAVYGEGLKKVFVWKRFETEKEHIKFVKDESELLSGLKEIVEDYKPDIIAGYYSDGFDMPYIKRRAEINKVKLDIGLDGSGIKISKGMMPSAFLTGITHLDIFKFIKKVAYLSLDSYDLNTVASELLEEKKMDVELENLYKVWDAGGRELDEYCEYNLHDARLVFELSDKMLPAIIEMVKIVGMPVFDVNRMGYSQLVEWYTIRQAFLRGEIAPNKPATAELIRRRGMRVKGAFVFEPKPGLYKDIEVFDYRSLYPTIISSHNIGPSSLRCDCCKDEEKIIVEGKGEFWYCKKKKDLIPELIKELIEKRSDIKKIIKEEKDGKFAFLDGRQNSLKLMANSFYGYLGFYGARWYCFDCAESTTGLGRKYIHSVIERAKGFGFGVIYSDTDSVFLTLGEKTKEDGKMFVNAVNKELPGLMELEFEGFYPSGIFVSAKAGPYGAKKKYALIDENGEMKIRGFETVRRNWSLIAKETQERVLDIILREHDREKALEYVKGIVKELREKKIPVKKVIIHTQLQKDISDYAAKGPHVAVAERMERMGKKVGPGTVIKYVVTQGRVMIRERSKLPEEVSQEDYDDEYYINNQVIPSVERIFDVLGIRKDELIESKEQSKLEKFF